MALVQQQGVEGLTIGNLRLVTKQHATADRTFHSSIGEGGAGPENVWPERS
jgi:hypothetical protein